MRETSYVCAKPIDDCSESICKRALLIVSEIRLVREGVAGVVEGHPRLLVEGLCETLAEARLALRDHPEAIVLLDGAFPGALEAVREIQKNSPSACVVAFAVSETEENIVAWAKAGAALLDVAQFLEGVCRGEQICFATIASTLMRRLKTAPGAADSRARVAVSLTTREHEIIGMLADGLSNKEIARSLGIEISTTKTHVHNVLGKLGFKRRGQIASWSHRGDRRQ